MVLPGVLEKSSVRHALIIGLFLWVSCCIGYWAVTKYNIYDPATGGRGADVGHYTRMSQGDSIESVPKTWRYRVVVPYLAGLIPDELPSFEIYYEVSDEKRLAFQFGVVNVLGMAAAAYFLFLSCSLAGLRHLICLNLRTFKTPGFGARGMNGVQTAQQPKKVTENFWGAASCN